MTADEVAVEVPADPPSLAGRPEAAALLARVLHKAADRRAQADDRLARPADEVRCIDVGAADRPGGGP